MPTKYEYPEGMTAEDKRKFRRQARAAAAKAAGGEGNGTEAVASEKPKRARKSSSNSSGGVVVEAPEPIEEEDEEEASEEDEEGLLRLFAEKGVQVNSGLQVGHGFQVKGFGHESYQIREAKVDKILDKFFIRWGHPASQIRLLPGRVISLGPVESPS